jgi:aryl-alcohol dehydrogenase-like predicted oxidoreductase
LRAVAAVAEGAGMSRLNLCLRFVMARPLVDRVIVGVTSVAELQQILDAARNPAALPDDLAKLASHDPDLLNPSIWPAKGQGDK